MVTTARSSGRGAAARGHGKRVESYVFRALSDDTRREILRVIGAGEVRVSDIAARFDVSRPAISKHLGILRRAGLVRERKQGRERYYALEAGPLKAAVEYVNAIDAFWAEGLQRLGEHLDDAA